jgi:hypothetical protein
MALGETMYQTTRSYAFTRLFCAVACVCLWACHSETKGDHEHDDGGDSSTLFDAAQSEENPATLGDSGSASPSADAATEPARDAGAMPARDAGSTTSDAQAPHTDAGQKDDAGTSADATAPACGAMFCEDFETGSLDTKRWTKTDTDMAANSVKVQSDMVAHGRFAAQFHAKGGSSRALMFLENLPQALHKHYFGRAHVRISDFPSEGGGHSAYVFSGSLDGYPWMDHHLEVGSYTSGSPVWQMTYWTGEGAEYIGSGGHIPKDAWFCLEWEFNDAPDQIAVWVDGDGSKNGASFRNINNNATGLLGEMKSLGLGFRTWHPMGAPDIDVYIDDIALDTKRIACVP